MLAASPVKPQNYGHEGDNPSGYRPHSLEAGSVIYVFGSQRLLP
jgi:hypothetical protein